LSNSSKVD